MMRKLRQKRREYTTADPIPIAEMGVGGTNCYPVFVLWFITLMNLRMGCEGGKRKNQPGRHPWNQRPGDSKQRFYFWGSVSHFASLTLQPATTDLQLIN